MRPAVDHRWRAVLRVAGTALRGRAVGLWETDASGHLHLVAADAEGRVPSLAADELETALHALHVDRPAGRRWVASHLKAGQWCIAPVRSHPPLPPPSVVERRGRERMTLELAGVCIGLLSSSETASGSPRQHADLMREHQARAALLAEQVPAVLWTTDRELRVTSSSGAALKSLVLVPERIVGYSMADARRGRGASPQALDAHRRALAGESVSYRLVWGERSFDAHVKPLRDQRHAVVGVVGIAVDVTAREGALEQLRLFKSMVDSPEYAILGKTLDGMLTSWNPAAERLYGYRADEAIGKPVSLIMPPAPSAELPDILARLRRGERVEPYETIRQRKDGTRVEVSVAISPIFDARGAPVGASAIARDITERKRTEAQLLHGALHDPLTDLPNRTLFIERVVDALKRARRDSGYRFPLMFLDFDGFKVINDSLGHGVGDELLKGIAERLRSLVRPADVVARIGGDEFPLPLEDVATPAEIEHTATRLQQGLAAPFTIAEKEIVASASIGAVLSEAGGARPEDLLRDADLAMYRAKAQGRARFKLFDVEMRDRARARYELETDLRNALERGEFRLLFQPIVELRTSRVQGFEALLRWQHPERGVVQPLEFISIDEETGLIVPLGNWG